jgi:hypothetical protein
MRSIGPSPVAVDTAGRGGQRTSVPYVVVATAQLACSFGAAPSQLTVLPSGAQVQQAGGQLIATIMDHKPQVNIAPFGMCSSLANPQVAAATSAAQGVLTPQRCIPMTAAPWAPGASTMTVGGMPVLTDPSTCACAWAGQITIVNPGQQSIQVE